MANKPPGSSGGYTPPDSGPVTRQEIYYLLLQQGFSTKQAIGIMANSLNEGGPESVGDNGTSFGFVQFHEPGYAGASSLVTHNPQKDIRAQIKYLAQVVTPNALAGNTPAEVAGNFAANFENCVGCQPGGDQHSSRVANAALISSAVSSGDWTQVDKSSVGGTGGAGTSGSASTSSCVIPLPKLGPIGGGCLFSKSQARALIGGLMVVGGGTVMFAGVVVLVATAFSGSKTGQAVGSVAGKVPGAGKVASKAMTATRSRGVS